MYANLKVSIHPNGKPNESEEVNAWAVNVSATEVEIKLDDQDGEGSYAIEAGVRVVNLNTHNVSIAADF